MEFSIRRIFGSGSAERFFGTLELWTRLYNVTFTLMATIKRKLANRIDRLRSRFDRLTDCVRSGVHTNSRSSADELPSERF